MPAEVRASIEECRRHSRLQELVAIQDLATRTRALRCSHLSIRILGGTVAVAVDTALAPQWPLLALCCAHGSNIPSGEHLLQQLVALIHGQRLRTKLARGGAEDHAIGRDHVYISWCRARFDGGRRRICRGSCAAADGHQRLRRARRLRDVRRWTVLLLLLWYWTCHGTELRLR